MVEQLHFHSSKWLFSLSPCELLIKIGKDIFYVQRLDITIWGTFKQRLKNFIKPEIHLLHLPTHPSKKQTNKKSLTLWLWPKQMKGRKLREMRCPESPCAWRITLFAANELNPSSCTGGLTLHWRWHRHTEGGMSCCVSVPPPPEPANIDTTDTLYHQVTFVWVFVPIQLQWRYFVGSALHNS